MTPKHLARIVAAHTLSPNRVHAYAYSTACQYPLGQSHDTPSDQGF